MLTRLASLLLAYCTLGSTADTDSQRRPFPLVEPVGNKLRTVPEGLAALRRIEAPSGLATVAILGPYRSGKSWTLNQLVEEQGVSCADGFAVGHERTTKTRGVELWGAPQCDSSGLCRVFFDTEGLGSTGKSDAYDDRIFALSAILSSLIIYNLPETVRERDIAKLSFAVELAQAFFADANGKHGLHSGTLEPAAMLWLIQRDFLRGNSIHDMLELALRPVDNPQHDPAVEEVNRVRASLKVVSANSTAFGLRQPHLDRTRLCELPATELDATFLQQLGELRLLVRQLARPKRLGGQNVQGPALADLVERLVAALNQREIPTTGSVLQHFNSELGQRALSRFEEALARLQLPLAEGDLAQRAAAARADALAAFEEGAFGARSSAEMGVLRAGLGANLAKALAQAQTANTLASTQRCSAAEASCEEVFEAQHSLAIPSKGRFEAAAAACAARFDAGCVGPAREEHRHRLERARQREQGRFLLAYNNRLLNGLVAASLVLALVFRFVLRMGLLELAAWGGFAFFQVYPKLQGESTLFESGGWSVVVGVWEGLASVLFHWVGGAGFVAALLLAVAQRRWRRRRSKKAAARRGAPPRDLDV